MTRKQEIEEMAKTTASHMTSDKDMQVAFADALRRGAEWADAHPKPITYEAIENVAKEVIDEDPQLDKLWDMIENDLRDKFIDKACEWLEETFKDGEVIAPLLLVQLIDKFRKAMK